VERIEEAISFAIAAFGDHEALLRISERIARARGNPAALAPVLARLASLPGPREAELREAVLRYTREVAFGAAQVYARTAEARGAWDALVASYLPSAAPSTPNRPLSWLG